MLNRTRYNRAARFRASLILAAGLSLALATQALAAPASGAKTELSPSLDLVASGYHSAVKTPEGKIWYWGGVADVIDGKHTFRDNLPRLVPELKDIVAIESLSPREILLKKDGTVWDWGPEYRLAVADDSANGTTEFPAPKRIEGLSRIVKISAGGIASAIDKDGAAWVWHPDRYFSGPHKLSNISDAQEISANANGEVHILLKNGTVWKWDGYIDRNANQKYAADKVNELKNVVSLSSGYGRQNFAIQKDGTVWGWGENRGGLLGLPVSTEIVERPIPLKHLTSVSAIVTGPLRTLVLKKDGSLWLMGFELGNSGDQLNFGPELQKVTGLKKVVSAALGNDHAVAATEDGKIWAWGSNEAGQLGNGTFKNSRTPVQVSGIR